MFVHGNKLVTLFYFLILLFHPELAEINAAVGSQEVVGPTILFSERNPSIMASLPVAQPLH